MIAPTDVGFEGDDDCSHRRDGGVEERPLGTVVGEQGHPVLPFQPACDETGSEVGEEPSHLPECDGLVSPRMVALHRDALPEPFDRIVEQHGQCTDILQIS